VLFWPIQITRNCLPQVQEREAICWLRELDIVKNAMLRGISGGQRKCVTTSKNKLGLNLEMHH